MEKKSAYPQPMVSFMTTQEIVSRGEELFLRHVQPQLQEVRPGDFVVMDVTSGDFEVDRDDLNATSRLLARHPDALTYARRIGKSAAYRLGGFSKVSQT